MGLFSGIGRRYRSFRRYNQIIRVFVKYGYEDIMSQLIRSSSFRFIRSLIPKTTVKRAKLHSKWVRMRLICEELGPTFVKFGQILSNRPDLLPAELVEEFEKLQDSVPPFSGKQARKVVESELGKSVEILFTSFEPEPFASASMAQVHKAILSTGENVAVKIQRPNIREMIVEDILIMYRLAKVFEKRMPSLRAFDLVGLVKHFESSIHYELDFVHESVNIQRFYHHLEKDRKETGARCPMVFQEYTTGKVLTMEFINGIKISDLDNLNKSGHDCKLIGEKLGKSYVKQVFEYGFFHADLHPGNILILPDGELCYLDFGLMGSIMPKDIDMLVNLFIGVYDQDIKKIIKALQQMSGDVTFTNIRAFEYDLNEFVDTYAVRALHSNEMSTVLLELRDLIIQHGIKVPAHFFLLARSMVTVEGVIHKLNPELDLMKLANPYMKRVFRKKLNPINWGKSVVNTIYEFGTQLEDFPRDLKNAIRRINTGKIEVSLNHKGIDPVVHTVNRVTKQIVSAVLVAGFLVASILLIINKIGPIWEGYSVFGVIGLIIALIIIFGMLRDIRKGDHDEWEGWKE